MAIDIPLFELLEKRNIFILGLDIDFCKTEVICPGFAKATPGAAVGLFCRI